MALALGLLAVSTILLTNILLGQSPASRAKTVAAPPKSTRVAVTRSDPNAPPLDRDLLPVAPGQTKTAKVSARFDISGLEARPTPSGVVVHASVRAMDSRETSVFLWTLTATHQGTKTVVLDQVYLDHRFILGPQPATPVFDDVLALPSGDYKIRVALLEFPRETKLDQPRKDWIATGQTVVSASRTLALE